MADVFRKGAKDVHRSIRDGGERYDVAPCNLDPGGIWGPTIPPGPRCPVCFGGRDQRRRRNKRLATTAGGAGVLALVAVVLAGNPDGDPVMPSPSFRITIGPSPLASSVLVTPGPQSAPPSATPALTPEPTEEPRRTAAPTATPRPTQEPTPVPTARPTPTPAPTCFHPGNNKGTDECKWPHTP